MNYYISLSFKLRYVSVSKYRDSGIIVSSAHVLLGEMQGQRAFAIDGFERGFLCDTAYGRCPAWYDP